MERQELAVGNDRDRFRARIGDGWVSQSEKKARTGRETIKLQSEDSIAADLHLLAAPFRLLIQLLVITALILSFPLICLGLLLLVGYGAQLHAWLVSQLVASAHSYSGDTGYPAWGWLPWAHFAFCRILVEFVNAPSPDDVSLLKVLLAVFGPFASSIWFAGIVHWYADRGERYVVAASKSFFYGFIGFSVSALAGGYVIATQADSVPAVYFCKAVVACFSSSLLYLVYRIFRTK